MKSPVTIFGLPVIQFVSFCSFLLGILTIWVHMEVRIAEVNVEIINLKQDIKSHKSENRKDFQGIHDDMNSGMREIVGKIDEIQIYLRNRK